MDPLTPVEYREYLATIDELPHPLLDKIIKESQAREDILPPVCRETGLLLHMLARITGSKQVLELGTGVGISTIFLALALPDEGRVYTIEKNPQFAAQAKEHFVACGVEHKISLSVGDVDQLVPDLNGEFDLVFQDAGKQTYNTLLADITRLLKPGGIFLADDTLMPAMSLPDRNKRTQRVIDRFNRKLADNIYFNSITIPIGKGLTVAQRKG